jgi:hypothetical protein
MVEDILGICRRTVLDMHGDSCQACLRLPRGRTKERRYKRIRRCGLQYMQDSVPDDLS